MEWLMSITHRGKYDLLVKSKILFDVQKGFSDYGFRPSRWVAAREMTYKNNPGVKTSRGLVFT